jgi:DNA-binding PadR family transcriptional regulator
MSNGYSMFKKKRIRRQKRALITLQAGDPKGMKTSELLNAMGCHWWSVAAAVDAIYMLEDAGLVESCWVEPERLVDRHYRRRPRQRCYRLSDEGREYVRTNLGHCDWDK